MENKLQRVVSVYLKMLCSVCGVEGIFEERGNSKRVVHYKGFIDKKRVYVKHSLGISPMGINGYKSIEVERKALGINKPDVSSISTWASSSARIGCCNHQQPCKEHQPPKLGVEGSNPSPSAIYHLTSLFNCV